MRRKSRSSGQPCPANENEEGMDGPLEEDEQQEEPPKKRAVGDTGGPFDVAADFKLSELLALRDLLDKGWDPDKHPRVPAGSSAGGQFGSGGGSDKAAASIESTVQSMRKFAQESQGSLRERVVVMERATGEVLADIKQELEIGGNFRARRHEGIGIHQRGYVQQAGRLSSG